jgi:flagellar basal-body rod protein FlgG
MRALSIAATGMSAQQNNVEVIANNIANINTTGFKRGRAEFTDLIYQSERPAGTPSRGSNSIVPEGLDIGLGVRTAAVRHLHVQGAIARTSNRLDLALVGRGYFQVAAEGGDTLYTRSGALSKNAQGQLVTIDGQLIVPEITIPENTSEVVVNTTGEVFARVGTAGTLQSLGQLTLANFANESGLDPLGQNLFRESEASGTPTVSAPGSPGFANIQQGYLESSNVDPVKEITELITAQRAYEMNSKVVQAADDMLGVVSKGIR